MDATTGLEYLIADIERGGKPASTIFRISSRIQILHYLINSGYWKQEFVVPLYSLLFISQWTTPSEAIRRHKISVNKNAKCSYLVIQRMEGEPIEPLKSGRLVHFSAQ